MWDDISIEAIFKELRSLLNNQPVSKEKESSILISTLICSNNRYLLAANSALRYKHQCDEDHRNRRCHNLNLFAAVMVHYIMC